MTIGGVSLSVLSNSGTQQPKMDKGIIYVRIQQDKLEEDKETLTWGR